MCNLTRHRLYRGILTLFLILRNIFLSRQFALHSRLVIDPINHYGLIIVPSGNQSLAKIRLLLIARLCHQSHYNRTLVKSLEQINGSGIGLCGTRYFLYMYLFIYLQHSRRKTREVKRKMSLT